LDASITFTFVGTMGVTTEPVATPTRKALHVTIDDPSVELYDMTYGELTGNV
jgi:hypothetical protein